MPGFGLNSARSFLGKTVNVHLLDGAVLPCVRLVKVEPVSKCGREARFRDGSGGVYVFSLKEISYVAVVPVEAQLLQEASV